VRDGRHKAWLLSHERRLVMLMIAKHLSYHLMSSVYLADHAPSGLWTPSHLHFKLNLLIQWCMAHHCSLPSLSSTPSSHFSFHNGFKISLNISLIHFMSHPILISLVCLSSPPKQPWHDSFVSFDWPSTLPTSHLYCGFSMLYS